MWISCTAAVSAVAEHSIMHQFARKRPDAKDKKELKEFAQKIIHKIKSGDEKEISVPGNKPYRKYNGVPGLSQKQVRLAEAVDYVLRFVQREQYLQRHRKKQTKVNVFPV